jgi:hypothetical protein
MLLHHLQQVLLLFFILCQNAIIALHQRHPTHSLVINYLQRLNKLGWRLIVGSAVPLAEINSEKIRTQVELIKEAT